MADDVRIIAGLGNPGKQYANTRHNIGFMALEHIAGRLDISTWKTKDGARQTYDARRKLVLLEPQTYMNNSGAPIRIIASWYRTPPESLFVIYDDMDIPFGTIRMRPFGGHGGHNGMRSIIATMGDRFPRLRIGIGRPLRQAQGDAGGQGAEEEPYDDEPIDHVLSPFAPSEREQLPKILEAAAEIAARWLDDSQSAMQFANTWTLETTENGR